MHATIKPIKRDLNTARKYKIIKTQCMQQQNNLKIIKTQCMQQQTTKNTRNTLHARIKTLHTTTKQLKNN